MKIWQKKNRKLLVKRKLFRDAFHSRGDQELSLASVGSARKNDGDDGGFWAAKAQKLPNDRFDVCSPIPQHTSYVEQGQIGDLPSMKINGGFLCPLRAPSSYARRVLNYARSVGLPETLRVSRTSARRARIYNNPRTRDVCMQTMRTGKLNERSRGLPWITFVLYLSK